jgi:hypothetical protein
VNNAGPTSYDQYVEFNEFDGGDGQMGVAGDGSKGDLEKIGDDSQQQVLKSTNQNVAEYKVSTKSRERSAKVAWGTSNGYADTCACERASERTKGAERPSGRRERSDRAKGGKNELRRL